MGLQDVNLSDIWADEDFNCRGHISPASVATLADDIDAQGLLQPVVVQAVRNNVLGTDFKIVMGHRRYLAQKLRARRDPRITTVRCIVLDQPVAESEARIMNIKENLEREPLNMLQVAKSLRYFKEQGWDVKTVAARLLQPKKWVEVHYGLLGMPEEIQRRAEAGYLSQYEVDHCLTLPTSEEQFSYVRAIVDRKEKGKNIEVKTEQKERRRRAVDVFAQGVPRTPAEMGLLQESIQDSFRDVKHPAAVALAWAAGVVSYQDFVRTIDGWAQDAGVEYVEHPEILKKA